ncbi:hypothetical protein PG991_004083 [Apiospora marii]|uniref:Uncharacterized protein n=1 Tax=Apiospora marii TaxID=335849 RepID=A0ABR1S7J7_9PEZI
MAETKKPYGWFDFPPEIRNMIYREALSAPDSEQELLPPLLPPVSRRLLSSDMCIYIDMFLKRFARKERLRRLPKQPLPLAVSLLRASKRVYAEAVGILYGENTMRLDNAPEVTDFMLRLIGRGSANFIRRASFPYSCQPLLNSYIGIAHDEREQRRKPESNAIVRLAEHCPGLREIVLKEAAILDDDWLDPYGSEEEEMEEVVVLEAFSRLNVYLWTAFPCLQRVVAQLRPPNPFTPRYLPALEDRMREAGWTVVVEENR